MKKFALYGGGLILVVLIAGGLYVYLQFDWLVKHAIESYGSEMLQAKVDVGQLKISPRTGEGEIGDLRIGNPKGFASKQAAAVGRIDLALEPGSLTSDVVLIKKIVIERPSLVYEQGRNGSNFDALQRNVMAYIGDRSPKEKQAETKMIVEELRITGAQVTYIPLVPVSGADLSFTLPDIHLRNLGKSRGGITSAELTRAILNAILERTATAIARSAAPRLLDRLLGR
ncbi:MAG TPA: hypothetical protein VJU83_04095 [Burkholderiales bacterium]|nr:hypothetical protein [Burkholderiales bacterium]